MGTGAEVQFIDRLAEQAQRIRRGMDMLAQPARIQQRVRPALSDQHALAGRAHPGADQHAALAAISRLQGVRPLGRDLEMEVDAVPYPDVFACGNRVWKTL